MQVRVISVLSDQVANNRRRRLGRFYPRRVFSAGDGVIYAVADDGDLLWYRHHGWGDGTFKWVDNNPRKAGTGWNFKQVSPTSPFVNMSPLPLRNSSRVEDQFHKMAKFPSIFGG